MAATISSLRENRLERSCEATRGQRVPVRMRIGRGTAGVERLEAHLSGAAFSPHRHDSYAIGITLSGVQTFRYRGQQRWCLPGQRHVLHPDEAHDGAAADAAGLSYRIAYIDPALVQKALGGRPLPFLRDPVVDASVLPDELAAMLWRIDEEIDAVSRIDLLVTLADMLEAAAGRVASTGALPLAALMRVRDLILAEPTQAHAMRDLEIVSGLDRWMLARTFRAAFGVSPGRFRTMRRLDHVRASLRRGSSLANTALDAGFSDQSHMSRQFKRAYGLTPAAWKMAVAAGAR